MIVRLQRRPKMGNKFLSKLNNVFDRILDTTSLLSGLMIIYLILSVCLEVILRYFFNRPTTWVTEIGAYTMLWIPFLASAWVLKRGQHVRMDLLVAAFGPGVQRRLNLITSSVATLVCAIITWFGVRVVIELYQSGTRTESYLMIIKWPIMGVIPLSTFLLFLEFLRRSLHSLAKREGE